MSAPAWIAAGVFVAVIYVFAFSLCAAAGRADELTARVLRETRRR